MNESKIELTARLRDDGRWPEASKFKDTVIAECRARGMKTAEAKQHAWEEMAKAFPPLSVEECPANPGAKAPEATSSGTQAVTANLTPAEELIDIDALLERVGDRQPPDLVRDTLWVYQHLADRNATPASAPSLGAWSLLLWARHYRNRFFEQLLPKAMLSKPPEDEEHIRQERKSIAEIEGVLGQIQKRMDEELRADVPGVLQKRVRDMLANWGQRCGVSLAADAQAHLDSAIVGLIRDSLRVFAPASGGK